MLTRRLLLLILGASTATWLSLSVVNAEPAKSRNQADADGSHDGRTQQQILAGWTQRARDVANSRLTWTENRIYPRGEMISPNRKETPVDDLVVQWNKSLVIVGDRCRIEGSGKTWLERIGDFAPFEFMAVLNGDASSLHRYPGQPEKLGYKTSFLPGLCDVTYRPAMLGLNPVDRNLGHINLDGYRVDPNPIDTNGRKCIKLMRIDNRNVDTHMFLDPERQFVVTRTVGLEGGKIARSLNLSYRQDGRGIWYPASWTLEIMNGTGTNHSIHITVVSTNFESQFDAGRQDFEIAFPAGTQIYDLAKPADRHRK